MSRFYFHVRTTVLVQDLEGTELASTDDARTEALDCALEMIADGVKAGQNRQGWSIEVADEGGQTVFVLPFAAALMAPEPASLAA